MLRLCFLSLLMAFSLFGCQTRPAPLARQTAPKYPVIVRIVGRHQTITVTAGPHGPLYSARRDGAVLFSNATLNEVRLRYPQIYRQIQPAYAQAGGAEGPIDTIAGWAGR